MNSLAGNRGAARVGHSREENHAQKTLLACLEGELDLLIASRPDQRLKVGDSHQIPAGAVHDAKIDVNKPLNC